ncbi:MAG: hypothetical protein AAGE84_21420 [Cyanobacteria bacterium P01_G01_bin.39]
MIDDRLSLELIIWDFDCKQGMTLNQISDRFLGKPLPKLLTQ